MSVTRQDRFDRWAPEYESSRLQSRFFQPLHLATLSELSREAPDARSILDVGCGTGLFLRRAAAAFPEAGLVGVDLSAEMIRTATEGAAGLPHLHFRQASADMLPFPDATFDAALSTASFHHWERQREGLAEVSRVLRAGGTLVLGDMLATGLMRFRVLASLVGTLDGGRFNTPDALDEMLASAGLRTVKRVPVPHFAGVTRITVARKR